MNNKKTTLSLILLLSCSAAVHAMDNVRLTQDQEVLVELIQAGAADFLLDYLAAGKSARLPQDHMPALFMAIQIGSLPMVRVLIEEGRCDWTAVYRAKNALQWAVACNQLEIVQFLTEILHMQVNDEILTLAERTNNSELINFIALRAYDQAVEDAAPRAPVAPAPAPAVKPAAKPAANVQKECIICADTKTAAEFYTLACNHEFCKECLNHVVTTNVPASIDQIKCPNPACAKAFAEQDLRNLVTDRAVRERLADAQAQRYLATQPDAKHCPTADCGYVFIKGDARENVTCTKCKTTYCNECTKPHDQTISCEQARAASQTDGASELWKRRNTKPCPRCNRAIEKNGGCTTVNCTQCHHAFCYNCLGPYDHRAHDCHEVNPYANVPAIPETPVARPNAPLAPAAALPHKPAPAPVRPPFAPVIARPVAPAHVPGAFRHIIPSGRFTTSFLVEADRNAVNALFIALDRRFADFAIFQTNRGIVVSINADVIDDRGAIECAINNALTYFVAPVAYNPIQAHEFIVQELLERPDNINQFAERNPRPIPAGKFEFTRTITLVRPNVGPRAIVNMITEYFNDSTTTTIAPGVYRIRTLIPYGSQNEANLAANVIAARVNGHISN